MSDNTISSQKIIIEKNKGITHALKKLVDSMPNSVISDGKITRSEWYATMDKIAEINSKRIEEGKTAIFNGGTNKAKRNYQE